MKRLLGGALLAGGTAVISGYTYARHIEPQRLVTEHVILPIAGLPAAFAGFTVVIMSDFHLHPLYTQLDLIQRAVATANQLQPDLIALPGDFIVSRLRVMDALAPVLGQLRARHGVYAVLGNHDARHGPRLIRDVLGDVGIPVLVNEGVLLTHRDAHLYVAGVDNCSRGYPDLAQALAASPPDAGLPGGTPVILLAHEPDFADQFAQDERVTLQLSGHTHGGQIRLPLWGPVVLPEYGRFYHSGLYRIRQMWLYTTRGIGTNGLPLRFLCPPEITHLTLMPA
ncbi:MAG: metallophosphoesterase [Chloroflexota bacterium]|nr:metallophosphoesterase [Anaerolineales bacterium]MCB8967045.1 metallophosphoesterase [Ardenticatenaceae bacterium]